MLPVRGKMSGHDDGDVTDLILTPVLWGFENTPPYKKVASRKSTFK